MKAVELKFSDMSTVADVDNSKVKLMVVPFNHVSTSGALSGVQCMFKSTAFDSSLAEIESGDSVAKVYGDAHKGQPKDLLASTAVKEGPGSFSMRKTKDGIEGVFEAAHTQTGRDITELINLGVLTDCSVGTLTLRAEDEWTDIFREAEKDGYATLDRDSYIEEVSMVNRGSFSAAKVLAKKKLNVFSDQELKALMEAAVADRPESIETADISWLHELIAEEVRRTSVESFTDIAKRAQEIVNSGNIENTHSKLEDIHSTPY